MLIRIYADDAKTIADDQGFLGHLQPVVTWEDVMRTFPLGKSSEVNLVKMRTGGITRKPLHHYFILFEPAMQSYVMDLLAQHCDKSRCYYIMPELR